MDSILFYGKNKDEASRRQVRSAAAQHSHRIGPRKAKASRRPRADSGNSRRQGSRTTAIAAAPVAPGSAGKLTPVGSADGPGSDTEQHPSVASHAAFPLLPMPAHALSSTYGPPRFGDQEQAQEYHAEHAHWEQARPDSQRPTHPYHHVAPVPSISPQSNTSQTAIPPPIRIQRIDTAHHNGSTSSHARSGSQSSSRSPTTRLPQYSWTEYPRYALGHGTVGSSMQTLARVAADRNSVERLSPVMFSHEASGARGNELSQSIKSGVSNPGDRLPASHCPIPQPSAPTSHAWERHQSGSSMPHPGTSAGEQARMAVVDALPEPSNAAAVQSHPG